MEETIKGDVEVSKMTIAEKIQNIYDARKNLKLEFKVANQVCKRIPLDLVIDNVKPENFEKELNKVINKTSKLSSACRNTILDIADAIYEK